MSDKNYVIGMDYGTDSCRAMIVDCQTGEELTDAVFNYPRWAEGKYCDPAKNQFRQHPLDYLEGAEHAIKQALSKVGEDVVQNIKGIGIDTTGSTPIAVDKDGTALALKSEFAENPNAMFVLWKDHTAIEEAEEINQLAKNWDGPDYTKYEGGIYSSEWFWAKILHVLRNDKAVAAEAVSWVEHCDWLPGVLTGNTNPTTMNRSRCAAGHKAMWHPDWDGLPAESFLTQLDPLLTGLRENLFTETQTAEVPFGELTAEWTEKLGLPAGVKVSGGAFDCHMGAVGANIEPYTIAKVIGTSTCDMVLAPNKDMEGKLVRGICGQVDGSITPGYAGLEAGQSAFGDLYAWFRDVASYPIKLIQNQDNLNEEQKRTLSESLSESILAELTKEASNIDILDSQVVAVDWMNGRRTPDADQTLKGAIMGLSLGSSTAHIFKALVEATAFGSKRINDRFEEEGIEIKKVVALGGIAKKSDYVMQVCADVFNREIAVVGSDQCCALGAAMFGAVAAGVFKDIPEAQSIMNSGFVKTYKPNKDNHEKYMQLYEQYCALGGFIEQQTEAKKSDKPQLVEA